MSKPTWELNTFKRLGITPEEAQKRAVEILRKHNYCYISQIDCPIDEVENWELIADLCDDEAGAEELMKKEGFDISVPSQASNFYWAFCG